jgi:hypothetical protein
MAARPRELADEMFRRRRQKIYTLPVDAARSKAREIIDQSPRGGYATVVERWRQLPDGRIEFAMRDLPTAG